jgi:hypothetical protein
MNSRGRLSLLVVAILLVLAPASGAGEEKARWSRDWAAEFRQNLQQGILKFWIDYANLPTSPAFGRRTIQGQARRTGKRRSARRRRAPEEQFTFETKLLGR